MIGIHVSDIKRLRKKILDADDYVKAGKSVLLKKSGVEKIAAEIEPEKKETVEDVVVQIPEAPVVRELVVDARCPNPRIMLAHFVADGKIVRVRVRVRDSGKFTRGMTIPSCRMVQETLYAYEGRAPRIKGRWL